MSLERWDVDLKILNGPMASLGTQVLRGPVVRIGTNPGPTGFRLTGYRGIDARQCVITVYSEGEAQITPVGTNQVRLAPHPHVEWKSIDPISGPEFINSGGAIHLGPVGRGCTIEFIKARSIADWTQAKMASEADKVDAKEVTRHAQQQVKRVGRSSGGVRQIAMKTLPIWFVGCMSMMLVSGASVVCAAILWSGPPEQLVLADLPEAQQREFYDEVDPQSSELVKSKLNGFNRAFEHFVANPNANQAKKVGNRNDISVITDPKTWDVELFKRVVASFEAHVRTPIVLKRMNEIKSEYAKVLEQVDREGLPHVFAAIPYLESRYRPIETSHVCALGWWQLMPEYGNRASRFLDLNYKVSGCPLQNPDGSFRDYTPDRAVPDVPVCPKAEYTKPDPKKAGKCKCAIISKRRRNKGVCNVDFRDDLTKSTTVSLKTLGAAWNDTEIAESGAAVQIAVLSHNAGYDASNYGYRDRKGRRVPKYHNLRASYHRWKKKQSRSDFHKFYGANLQCPKKDGDTKETTKACLKKGVLLPRLQHYGYPILGQHLVATCFYAMNYSSDSDIFRKYRTEFVDPPGEYCNLLKIKTVSEL